MARKLLIATVLAALVLPPSSGTPREDGPAVVDVTSEVKLIEKNATKSAMGSSPVALWLVPLPCTENSAAAVPAKHHYRMLQENKTFEPKLLVVPLGSRVDFPNLDPWFHNVFSLYQGKRFDLGLYQAGAEKEVVFDRPGPSFLFCNIHPQMTAVILTVNSDFFGISDKAGHISIPRVPTGRYALHVWYENAASEFTDVSPRPVDIGPGENILPPLSVPVANHGWSHKDKSHKDKYGYDYDPKASAPAY